MSYREDIRRFAQAWNKIWFSQFDPVSVSVFRIFLGSLITVFYLLLFPNWERFYAADGVTSLTDPAFPNPSNPWTLFHWTEPNLPIGVYWWIGLFSAILFTLGWKTRLCTVLLFVMECSLLNRSLPAMNGEDVVFRMLLFYGMFAPLGDRLSIDSFLKKRKGQKVEAELPTIWAVRAMQINFALIYAISLPYKLVDDVAWWNGDAIYLAIVSSMWSRWPWPEMFYAFDGLLSKVFTYGTVLAEGSFPTLVWFNRPKLYVICTMATLHIGIAVMLNGVTFFSLSMVCALWIFVPAEITWKLISRLASIDNGFGRRCCLKIWELLIKQRDKILGQPADHPS
ncbi:MAG: hypothetical protein HYW07_03505 [Candidatus Latescibacteria bacterium]|nr:hypothetical protein [Candidatus Latescibacterota bacterium]